ncbi:MAG: isoleucine--tRNA ligase [Alloprevotella sp.]|nr:isoleucine--tRNA ligase [Alloprevotella sp.]
MKFNEHNSQDLYQVNQDVLAKWERDNVFAESIRTRKGHPAYVFYDGPPSANGHPGIHHVMARTIKDLFCRYKTMQGYCVERKAGWDTHGLPVELGVEAELGITKVDIGTKISIEDYNAHCRKNVMKYTREWEELTRLMGYWADMDHPYITYETPYMESLWWLLHALYEKGLLYKGYTIQPYSPAAGTGLSSHELNLPGCYRDVKDLTATALFRLTDAPAEMSEWGTAYMAAWTTTPWTLPSNTALCVGGKIEYVCVQTFNPYSNEKISVIMASACVANNFAGKKWVRVESLEELAAYDPAQTDAPKPFRVVGHWDGNSLAGLHYEQLLNYMTPKDSGEPFRVITGDYVTTEDGTGIVHIAPTFGADDAFVAKKAGVPGLLVTTKKGKDAPMVDLQGRFYRLEDLDEDFVRQHVNVEAYEPYMGRYVKNAYDENLSDADETLDLSICFQLKSEGKLLSTQKHVHSYPHCWRTDKPVLYYPLDSWFIRSTALKERMSELNKTIKWKPESTGTGRFGKWLENLNDWNLSRSRFWGTPLPIWRNDEGEEICIGSLADLYAEIEKSVAAGLMASNPLKDAGFIPGDYSKENYAKVDLHRPYVDRIVLVSDTGKPLHREPDLIDVWFDSGAMPYAQSHFPFENTEGFENKSLFPADFIAEGVDQTRGWFFTLHALATMIFDSVAFKNVVSNGLVLDKNGNKMSKHLGNAVEPFGVIQKYGSDPLRWFMITNSAPWDNLKFDEDGVKEVSRTFFGKLYQVYSFFAMYANVDGFDPTAPQVPAEERPEIDRWIISELNSLIKRVTENLDDYEPTKAGRDISTFVNDNLSNWYVRLNRKRFWAGQMTADKLSAYQTLYRCLLTLSKLVAPFAPFYADQLYADLQPEGVAEAQSVHLSEFPKVVEAEINPTLEKQMELAQKITSMVLSLRKKEHIIVRQPLQNITLPISDEATRSAILAVKQLILDEVNVKTLNFAESSLLKKEVKCNFRIMGKKFGKQMKAVAAAVSALSQEQIAQLEQTGLLTLPIEEQTVTIELADVEIITKDLPGWTVANEGALTVALDLTISPELYREGVARELIKKVQTYRKEHDFEITDHIRVILQQNDTLETVLKEFGEYIGAQILADSISLSANPSGEEIFEHNDIKSIIEIIKI